MLRSAAPALGDLLLPRPERPRDSRRGGLSLMQWALLALRAGHLGATFVGSSKLLAPFSCVQGTRSAPASPLACASPPRQNVFLRAHVTRPPARRRAVAPAQAPRYSRRHRRGR